MSSTDSICSSVGWSSGAHAITPELYIGACILTPHAARRGPTRLVTTVRELRDFLFGGGKWRPGATGDRPGDWERVRNAALNASGLWVTLPDGDLWRAAAVRRTPRPTTGRSTWTGAWFSISTYPPARRTDPRLIGLPWRRSGVNPAPGSAR